MRTLIPAVIALGLMTPAVAFAQDAGPPPGAGAEVATADGDAPTATTDGDLLGRAGELVSAIKDGDAREIVALVLILVVGIGMRLSKWVPGLRSLLWEKDDFGNYATVRDGWGTLFLFAMSTIGALGTAIAGGADIDFALFRAAFVLGVLAAGGYSVLWKKVVKPKLVTPIVERFR